MTSASAILPSFNTASRSHCFQTLLLCVMNKTAERLLSLLSRRRRRCCRSSCSDAGSNAELASSKAVRNDVKKWEMLLHKRNQVCNQVRKLHSPKILGFVNNALAIQSLCFCPPEMLAPLSPTIVSYCSGSSNINLCALAAMQASTTSSWEALGLPYATFSETLAWKSIGSCPTRPICDRSHSTSRSQISLPPSVILPEDEGS